MLGLFHSIIADTNVVAQLRYITPSRSLYRKIAILVNLDRISTTFYTNISPFIKNEFFTFIEIPLCTINIFIAEMNRKYAIVKADNPTIAITSRRFCHNDILHIAKLRRLYTSFNSKGIAQEHR